MSSSTQIAKKKIFVLDDHPIVRQGLSQLVNEQADLSVCGVAPDAASALEAMDDLSPDLLVLDISLDGPDGLDFLKRLRLRDNAPPVLVLSMHDESLYAERALRAGAKGYIMKQVATESLLAAIRKILRGGIYLSDGMAARMLHQFANRSGETANSPLADLSDRELEVFRLIGEGQGTREIAELLHVSVKTVESYQAHLKEKLCLRNSRELVQRAIHWVSANRFD
jgi:DNA-binding NarL/FixJ family response regulator